MEKRYVIGVDLGTTTIKAVFVDAKENRIAATQTEEIFTVGAETPDFIEFDANDWETHTKSVLARGFAAGIDPEEVAGICFLDFTVMAFLVDKQGEPLNHPVHYNDFRHLKESEELAERIGEICIARNGNYMGMYNGLAKQYWWKKNRPEIYARAKYFVTGVVWMGYKLTGKWAQNRTSAGFFGQYNAYTREWDTEILDMIGMSPDKFPPLIDAWEVLGEVTESAAREWGLAPGTKVFGGTDDASPVALTTGAIREGQCFISSGSGANVVVNTAKPLSHPTALTYPHCIPGLFMTIGVLSSTGLSYKWLRNQLGLAEETLAHLTGEDAYTYLNRQAEMSPPGSNGVIFLPYLDGDYTPNNDPNARGCFIGIGTATKRSDIIRAVMEGVGFSFLSCIMMIRDLGGDLNDLVITGGITKSTLWLQIISDITGLSISLPEEPEGAPLGSALLAAVGCGFYESYEDAVKRVVKINQNAILPNQENHMLYQDIFNVYQSLYPNLKDTFAELADIKNKYNQ